MAFESNGAVLTATLGGSLMRWLPVILLVVFIVIPGGKKSDTYAQVVKTTQSRKDAPKVAGASKGKKPLLKRYKSDFEIPDDLYKTYEKLTVAFKAGDQKSIESLCLPFSVKVKGVGVRPASRAGLGEGVNLYFARTGFEPEIIFASQKDKDIIQLRTPTSMLWFVQTKRGVWRLYAYVDKSIV